MFINLLLLSFICLVWAFSFQVPVFIWLHKSFIQKNRKIDYIYTVFWFWIIQTFSYAILYIVKTIVNINSNIISFLLRDYYNLLSIVINLIAVFVLNMVVNKYIVKNRIGGGDFFVSFIFIGIVIMILPVTYLFIFSY